MKAQITELRAMRLTKTKMRVNWINAHRGEIEAARTTGHSDCRGQCHNGRTCYNQSGPGWGWWANALSAAGIDPERRSYWSGSNPTPSTSINRGVAAFISKNAPDEIR